MILEIWSRIRKALFLVAFGAFIASQYLKSAVLRAVSIVLFCVMAVGGIIAKIHYRWCYHCKKCVSERVRGQLQYCPTCGRMLTDIDPDGD